jgi:hypothetical protein
MAAAIAVMNGMYQSQRRRTAGAREAWKAAGSVPDDEPNFNFPNNG